jgi:hypothetical protein
LRSNEESFSASIKEMRNSGRVFIMPSSICLNSLHFERRKEITFINTNGIINGDIMGKWQ